MKRNSTVKEFRKQKLIDAHPHLNHEPQSVVECISQKTKGKKKKGKKRGRKRSKRFRDLSQGNQIKYKGRRGFEIIKKYRDKRRNES